MAGRNDIANILLQIEGRDEGAERTLDELTAALQAFGREDATAKADVDTSGQGKLLNLIAELEAFSKGRYEAKAEVRVDQGAFQTALLDIREITKHQGIELPVTPEVRRAQFVQALAEIQALRDPVKVELIAKLDKRSVASSLAEVQALLPRDENLQIKPDVIVAPALAKLEGLRLASDALTKDRPTIRPQVDTSPLQKLEGVYNTVTSTLNSGAQSAERSLSGLFDTLSGVTVNFGAFGAKLGPITVAVIAAAGAIGLSLVGALSLLVTAAAAAAAGIAALGTAFLAALGPGVALAVAVFAKLANIIKVVKDLQKAKDDQERKGAGSQAAKAEEEHRQKLLEVKNALLAVTQARQNYQQAQQSSKQAIIDADKQQAQAAESLKQANQDVKDQTVNAYHAIAQAAQDARDAILGVKDARLSVQEAGLAVQQAALDLENFRKNSDTASKSLDSVFKKFANVNFKGNVKSGLQSLGLDKKSALEGEKLILQLKRAKLNEQEATNNLTKSENNLKDARAKNNEFQRQGISAYKSLTDAIKRQRQAERNLADATAKALQLQRQGVARTPAVVNARNSLAQAENRLKQARLNAAKASDKVPDSVAKAHQEFNKLDKAAQRFALTLIVVKKRLSGFASGAVDGVLNGLTHAASKLPTILNPLRKPFTRFGQTVGQVLSHIFDSFSDKRSVGQFASLIDAARRLSVILGGKAFVAFGHILLDIATASMPTLLKVMGKFADALAGLSKKTRKGDGLSKFLDGVFKTLGDVWGLVKAVARVFGAFFNDTNGNSQGLVKTLTNVANKFADFLNSKQGRKEIQLFFKEILPLAGSFLKLLGAFGVVFIRAVEILSPALQIVINGFTTVLKVLAFVLDKGRFVFTTLGVLVAVFASGPITAINAALGFIGNHFGRIHKLGSQAFHAVASVATSAAHAVGSIATSIGHTAARLAGWVQGGATKGFHLVSSLASHAGHLVGSAFHRGVHLAASVLHGLTGAASSVVGKLSGIFHRIGHFIANGVRAGINFLPKALSAFYNFGAHLIHMIVKGIESTGKSLYHAIKKKLGFAGKLFPGSEPKDKTSPLYGLPKSGRAIFTNVIKGLNPGSEALTHALKRNLKPTQRVIQSNVRVPTVRAPVLANAGLGASHTEIGDINLQVPGGGTPDGMTAARIIQKEVRRRRG